MRQMKTAMDVRIRQQRGPSFQNPDMEIRQAGSMRIRVSFALREVRTIETAIHEPMDLRLVYEEGGQEIDLFIEKEDRVA